MTDELGLMDATAQAELVATGEAKPVELVDAAIARIEKLNPQLNAVIVPLFDEARDAALSPDLPDGPFRGVPFLLKDLWEALEGMPMFNGNRALRDAGYRCTWTSISANRYRRAGFVTVGKTNTPEMGIQTTTQPLAFGPTRNPWDVSRSTNGSSGGSAAAVASGMVPAANGSDGGGSIRLPAAWCGVVGLKPSRGRVSAGRTATGTELHVSHVVTRTVRDAAGILDAVHGPEPGDVFLVPPPARPYGTEVGAEPGQLRVGLLSGSHLGWVRAECVRAAQSTARLLESLGHVVEESWPSAMFETGDADLGGKVDALRYRGVLMGLESLLGHRVTQDDVEPYLWQLANQEAVVSGEDVLRAQFAQQQRRAAIAGWWAEGFDLLLTPTVYEPAAGLDELVPPEGNEAAFAARVWRTCAFAAPFNMTGQPAMSLPMEWTDEGLPIGVQLVAGMCREDVLIRISSQLEAARPWGAR